jgi:amino acid transporter
MSIEPKRFHSPLRLRKRAIIDVIAICFALAIVLATVSGVVSQKKIVAHARPAPTLVTYTTNN